MRKIYVFLVILGFFSIPLFYNSCQAGLFSNNGFQAANTCRLGPNKGQVSKLKMTRHESPFAAQKLLLNNSTNNTSANQLITKSSELAVLVNLSCLQASNPSTFLNEIIDLQQPFANLDQQSFVWRPQRDYSYDELTQILSTEPCIIGMAPNLTYQTQSIFNDTSADFQAHLSAVKLDKAYSLIFDPLKGINKDTANRDVLLAVLDTGADDLHQDLTQIIWRHQQGWGVDATTIGSTNVNYNPTDISPVGHGTHVAGLAAAQANNQIGIVGIAAHRTKIMVIRIFRLEGAQLTTTSQIFANAIRFAYLNGANVINLSIARAIRGVADDPLYLASLQEAIDRGVFVVSALGNAEAGQAAREVDGVQYTVLPAKYARQLDGMMAIGSYDVVSSEKSFFSNYSTAYGEISAPGTEDTNRQGLYSTVPRDKGEYARLYGTSQAVPLVAGAAALAINMIRDAYGVAPHAREIERLLSVSATKSSALRPYFKDGNALNIESLVYQIKKDYPATNGQNAGRSDLSSLGCGP